MKATTKPETKTTTTYIIRAEHRGRPRFTDKLASTLLMTQEGDYFLAPVTERVRVISLARSLRKSFTTSKVDENTIRVSCTATW